MRTPQLSPNARLSGFSRVDLLALMASLALLALIVIPSLAETGSRSERFVCLNNLGQIGRAYQMWANDHGDRFPFPVSTNEGGLYQHPLGANVYFQFLILSNELRDPSVLACPSDLITRRARDFSSAPGGLLNGALKNNAVSYFVTHPFDGLESRLLAGDRNLEGFGGASGCSLFLSALRLQVQYAAWRDSIHMSSGNLLYQSGAVEQTGNTTLQTALRPNPWDIRDLHLVVRP